MEERCIGGMHERGRGFLDGAWLAFGTGTMYLIAFYTVSLSVAACSEPTDWEPDRVCGLRTRV